MKNLTANGMVSSALLAVTLLGCARTVDMSSTGGSGSEVAVTVVSGGVNSAQTNVAMLDQWEKRLKSHRSFWQGDWISSAQAATFTCVTGTFSPATCSTTPQSYTFAPGSCSVSYDSGKSASTTWSGVWTYNYGADCTGGGFLPKTQPSGCVITRTSPSTGVTRSLVGPDGNSYVVTHNTNGQSTGWDSSIAVSDAGVTVSCTNSGCTEQTLMINGSHITAKANSETYWDHTVSTNTGLNMTINNDGSHTVSGVVTVQQNLVKILSTTTFNNVNYGGTGEDCCFPTSGSVTTTYTNGPNAGKSETLTFSGSCGDATLTTTGGNSVAYPLIHCI